MNTHTKKRTGISTSTLATRSCCLPWQTLAWFGGRLDLCRGARDDDLHCLLLRHFACLVSRQSRKIGAEVRMRNLIFIRVYPTDLTFRSSRSYTLNNEGKMAGNFLKLVVFITLSLHYVAAQGTSE